MKGYLKCKECGKVIRIIDEVEYEHATKICDNCIAKEIDLDACLKYIFSNEDF